MTQPTGSDTSTTDQVSAEPSEFPPPSPKADLKIFLLPDDKGWKARWKQLMRILR